MEKETLSTSCGRKRMLPVNKEVWGDMGQGLSKHWWTKPSMRRARKSESRT